MTAAASCGVEAGATAGATGVSTGPAVASCRNPDSGPNSASSARCWGSSGNVARCLRIELVRAPSFET